VLSCICHGRSPTGQTCLVCGAFVHICLAPKANRGEKYECASCLNREMDPLYQVKRVLVESYFRTQSIFHYANVVNFEFLLKPEDKDLIVEVRGLHSGHTSLSWPMQGGFSLNDDKANFHDFKPLLTNSNRKARREEYFSIPEGKLKPGKNHLKFKIPCLDSQRFCASYQY
jgi:hypothetical protein